MNKIIKSILFFSFHFFLFCTNTIIAQPKNVPYIYSEVELQGIKILDDFISSITFDRKASNGEDEDILLFVKNNGEPIKIEIENDDFPRGGPGDLPGRRKLYSLFYTNFIDDRNYNYTSLAAVYTTDNATFDNGVYIGMPETDFWNVFGLSKDMPKEGGSFIYYYEPKTHVWIYGVSSYGWSTWFYFDNNKLISRSLRIKLSGQKIGKIMKKGPE